MYRYLVVSLFVVVCFTMCKKNKSASVNQPAIDEGIITTYISDNKLDAKATGSGLYYVIKSQGTGKQPASTSTVTVNYKGYLTNGGVFDQHSGSTFSLDGVIAGWQEGIPYLKEGGKGTLLVPSALGYGSQAQANIPANSVLIFDVELTKVK